MLSARTRWDFSRNPLAEAWDRRWREGLPCRDLTQSNPTACGFSYPQSLLAALSSPEALIYHPESRGLPKATEAVANHISSIQMSSGLAAPVPCSPDRGSVDPSSILLCAGTSEAYGWLFKLLCDPGDHILVPRPSYPLLDYLADLEGVIMTPYTLRYDGRWNLDRDALEEGLTPHTRAVVVIHPNNPTGSLLSGHEANMLSELCTEHDLALISDEVFLEYPLPPGGGPCRQTLSDEEGQRGHVEAGPSARTIGKTRRRRTKQDCCIGSHEWAGCSAASLAIDSACLTFSLGGLSKSCGLPQLKVGWIHMGGPQRLVRAAMERLEIVSDTYLSVNTPAQLALPEILKLGREVGDQIRGRTACNWAWLRDRASRATGAPWSLLDAEAGWYATLRIPNTRTEDRWCLDILERHGILLHPGYFFDFPTEAFVVASLLSEEDEFRQAMDLVLEFVEQGA